jgi:ABC-type sugar transport system ATPase subunit
VLLLDEPTRGIDLHAKEQIFELIRQLADAGLGVILVSSEFEELTALCDTILVLRGGSIAERLDAAVTTPEQLLDLASREEAA